MRIAAPRGGGHHHSDLQWPLRRKWGRIPMSAPDLGRDAAGRRAIRTNPSGVRHERTRRPARRKNSNEPETRRIAGVFSSHRRERTRPVRALPDPRPAADPCRSPFTGPPFAQATGAPAAALRRLPRPAARVEPGSPRHGFTRSHGPPECEVNGPWLTNDYRRHRALIAVVTAVEMGYDWGYYT